MKKLFVISLVLALICSCVGTKPEIESQWNGARAAYLGDSITDACQIGNTNDTYWNMFRDILGIEPLVYGINGHQMSHIIGQAEKLEADHGQDMDAIIIFVGTNDYNASVPIGQWYEYDECDAEINGHVIVTRKHRSFNFDPDTFCGRINLTMKHLKSHFPEKQIILLTPIHRGYATFGDDNIQPCEDFANGCGFFIDDYVQAIKEAANVWAVPVIDLNSVCGLFPTEDSMMRYFRNADTDQIHPNTEGHRRMAYAIAYQLLGYPAEF